MGISLFFAELIVREHLYKPLPETVHLLGKQTVFFDEHDAIKLLRHYNIEPVKTDVVLDTNTVGAKAKSERGYISDTTFFQMLGVKEVKAIDHSDFEGAEIIVDLNRPLPPQYEGVADFILGGSVLDNIFDPATYIKNLSRLLKPGGRLIDPNAYSFHAHPYLMVSPAWYYDYYVLNRFADCKIYLIEASCVSPVHEINVETKEPIVVAHIYGLDVAVADNLIADFGSPSASAPCAVVIVAEKGAQSSWDEVPSQDQYRGEEEWSRYRTNLAALKQSARPVLTFSTPSPLQLERHPLRRIKSLPYLGCYIPFAANDYALGSTQLPAKQIDTGIRIVEATYGWNNQQADLKLPGIFPLCRGNVTETFRHLVNCNESLDILLDVEFMGDPAPGLSKDLQVIYYYANDPAKKLREAYVPGEAHGQRLVIPSLEAKSKSKKISWSNLFKLG